MGFQSAKSLPAQGHRANEILVNVAEILFGLGRIDPLAIGASGRGASDPSPRARSASGTPACSARMSISFRAIAPIPGTTVFTWKLDSCSITATTAQTFWRGLQPLDRESRVNVRNPARPIRHPTRNGMLDPGRRSSGLVGDTGRRPLARATRQEHQETEDPESHTKHKLEILQSFGERCRHARILLRGKKPR